MAKARVGAHGEVQRVGQHQQPRALRLLLLRKQTSGSFLKASRAKGCCKKLTSGISPPVPALRVTTWQEAHYSPLRKGGWFAKLVRLDVSQGLRLRANVG